MQCSSLIGGVQDISIGSNVLQQKQFIFALTRLIYYKTGNEVC